MGIFIMILVAIGCVCFFRSQSFQHWMWQQRYEEEAQKKREEAQKKWEEEKREEEEFCEKGVQFCESILNNDAVKAMADKMLETLKNTMLEGIRHPCKNITQYDIGWGVDCFSVRKQKYNYEFRRYEDDYGDKSGLSLYFSDYGIQMSDEPYKAYGLALALETLITSQAGSFPAEVKDFKIRTLSHSKSLPTLVMSWTIQLNKFVEL